MLCTLGSFAHNNHQNWLKAILVAVSLFLETGLYCMRSVEKRGYSMKNQSPIVIV